MFSKLLKKSSFPPSAEGTFFLLEPVSFCYCETMNFLLSLFCYTFYASSYLILAATSSFFLVPVSFLFRVADYGLPSYFKASLLEVSLVMPPSWLLFEKVNGENL